jgi:Tol biopolymer transport system component
MKRCPRLVGGALVLVSASFLALKLLTAADPLGAAMAQLSPLATPSSAALPAAQSPLEPPPLVSASTCDAPWPTPPAVACPWLPTPTPEPTSSFPTPTSWVPPLPPDHTPTPLPGLAAARTPDGVLAYRGVSFQSRDVDGRGNVAHVSQKLDFQAPVGVDASHDYFAYFDRLIPAPGGRYVAAVAEVEVGEIVTFVDLTTNQSANLYWHNTKGEPVIATGFFYNWHPNGYEFLFREDNAPDRGLWLVDARTGEHRLIAQQPTLDISGAAISPDGQRLIYATNTFDVHQIWTANADGSDPRLLLESDMIVYVFSWSPDGRYLLYAGEPSTTVSDVSGGPLWIMDREGRSRKPLQMPFAFGFGFWPVWSPGGHQVAAVGTTNEHAECWSSGEAFRADPLCRYRGTGVYVENVEAGEAQLVAHHAIDPAWSPDGTLLAMSKMDDRQQVDIWLVNQDGKELRQVTDTPEVDRRPVWLKEEAR